MTSVESGHVYVHYRLDGQLKLLNTRELQAKCAARQFLLELMFADDMGLACHTVPAMQRVCDRLHRAVTKYGLTISLGKTEFMAQFAPVEVDGVRAAPPPPPVITIDGTALKTVPQFVYLGGKLANDGTLDAEIAVRIQRAAAVFGKLWARVWSQSNITTNTKVALYRATVLTTLLYGCETWAATRRQLKKMEAFHHRCLRRLMGIKWQELVPTTDVLARAGIERVETMIRACRLKWLGHVARMPDDRLPKKLLFGKLEHGARHAGGQKRRWKDCVKEDMLKFAMVKQFQQRQQPNFADMAADRPRWRAKIAEGACFLRPCGRMKPRKPAL